MNGSGTFDDVSHSFRSFCVFVCFERRIAIVKHQITN